MDFGALLRDLRLKANLTLADLAEKLELSVVYLSDIERGRRPPFDTTKIRRAAQIIGVDPDRLLAAAALARGGYTLAVTDQATPLAREVGAALARDWSGMSDPDLMALQELLKTLGSKQ